MDLWLLTICGLAVAAATLALLVARALRIDRKLLAALGHFTADPLALVGELAQCAALARSAGPGALHTRTPAVRHPLLSRGAQLVAKQAEPPAIRSELNTLADQLLRTYSRRHTVARWLSLVAPVLAIASLTLAAAMWLPTLEDPTAVAGGFALAALALFACGTFFQALASVGAPAVSATAALTISSVIVIEGLVAIREGQDQAGVMERLAHFLPEADRPAALRRAA
ncbi:MAG: hypothetical protein ACREJO_02725 [Phycisphaerales bacterium]